MQGGIRRTSGGPRKSSATSTPLQWAVPAVVPRLQVITSKNHVALAYTGALVDQASEDHNKNWFLMDKLPKHTEMPKCGSRETDVKKTLELSRR